MLLKVDGGFSMWSSFGDCSKTCGGGLHTRTRQCNNPSPQHGGVDCVGKKEESQLCNTEGCPGNNFVFCCYSSFSNDKTSSSLSNYYNINPALF